MNGWWSKLGVLLETKAEAVSCALHFSSIFSVYQEILGIIFGRQLLSRTLMLIDAKVHSLRFRVVTNIYSPAVWLTTTHPQAKQKMLRLLNSSYFLSKYGAQCSPAPRSALWWISCGYRKLGKCENKNIILCAVSFSVALDILFTVATY